MNEAKDFDSVRDSTQKTYCARAQSISQHVDAGQLNIPP